MERKVTLSFEPQAHVYSDETGLVYTSATTVIGLYKKPFNKRYWSMYTTLKNSGHRVQPVKGEKGIVVDGKFTTIDSLYRNPINSYEVNQLVDSWGRMTEEACARGNKIHDYLEDTINLSKGDVGAISNADIQPSLTNTLGKVGMVELRTIHDLDSTTLKETFPAVYKRLSGYIEKGCTIYAEKKIYSTTYQIAGMIDVLIVKGKQFAILDWKTNKDKMMFSSGYFKKVKQGNDWIKSDTFITTTGDTLLAPLNNIDNCKGMVYTLQLSLYAYIMELWGYVLVKGGLEIFHMRPGLEPKLISVRYLKHDIQNMLEHHLKTRILKETPNNLFGIS